jgi:hypothetical protein
MQIRAPQRLYVRTRLGGEDIVRTEWRHSEFGRNDRTSDFYWNNNIVGLYPV